MDVSKYFLDASTEEVSTLRTTYAFEETKTLTNNEGEIQRLGIMDPLPNLERSDRP